MIKRTLYFGNPFYLSFIKAQMPATANLTGFKNLSGLKV